MYSTFTPLTIQLSTASRAANFHISLAAGTTGLTASTTTNTFTENHITSSWPNKFTFQSVFAGDSYGTDVLVCTRVRASVSQSQRRKFCLAGSRTRVASFACHSTFLIALPWCQFNADRMGPSAETLNVLPRSSLATLLAAPFEQRGAIVRCVFGLGTATDCMRFVGLGWPSLRLPCPSLSRLMGPAVETAFAMSGRDPLFVLVGVAGPLGLTARNFSKEEI